MNRRQRIENALRAALDPVAAEVEDQSARHAGHAGAPAEGETHFRVLVVAEIFRGLTRVERQRLVYGALAEELRSGLHAVALETRIPEEYTHSE